MKEVRVRETNFASGQINRMESITKDFYFGGGELVFRIPNKMVMAAKRVLGKSIIAIE